MRDRIIEILGLDSFGFLVPNYGFMLTLAIIVGVWLTLRESRRQGLAESHTYQAVFYAALFLLPGARVVYALQYPHLFPSWTDLLDPTRGGVALYGGLFGVLVSLLYLRRQQVPLRPYLDALAPALALGVCIGRLGCFSAGCNWGTVTHLPWGVRFPGPKHAYAQHLQAGLIEQQSALSLPVHPTQLYESLFAFLMLFVAYRWLRQLHWPGSVFLRSIACYALFRFAIEFLRADSHGVTLGPVSFAQGLSLLTLLTCLVLLYRHAPKAVIAEGSAHP